MILYISKNGKSLLDKSNLKIVYEIEQKIKGMKDWKLVCKAASINDLSCGMDSYFSPLAFLLLGGQFKPVPDLTQDEIDTAWANVVNDPVKFAQVSKLVQKKEGIDKNGGKVIHMRAFIQFGLPFKIGDVRYENIKDRQPEQKQFIGDF
jgi:hypothetical protein